LWREGRSANYTRHTYIPEGTVVDSDLGLGFKQVSQGVAVWVQRCQGSGGHDVQGLGFQGSGHRAQGSGLRAQGSSFRVRVRV